MKTTGTPRAAGFTLVEIMIVVAIIGMLAAIAIPNFVRARANSQQKACINNLRQIDSAINEWALETGQSNGGGRRRGRHRVGLHQIECQRQRSGLPGARRLYHAQRRGRDAGGLLVEHPVHVPASTGFARPPDPSELRL
jgi:prepilin-type N-terminal cleavage/methylation domain-containing protein